jgi:GH25 family lysozyme M1 (1,4-beta-N-acetylmuramidase)
MIRKNRILIILVLVALIGSILFLLRYYNKKEMIHSKVHYYEGDASINSMEINRTNCELIYKDNFILGIDHYFEPGAKGYIDTVLLNKLKIKFVLIKNTGTIGYSNRNFQNLKDECKILDTNFYRGFWDYLYYDIPVDTQISLYKKSLDSIGFDKFTLPPILDIEINTDNGDDERINSLIFNNDPKYFDKGIIKWITEIEKYSNRKVIIYTGIQGSWDELNDILNLTPETLKFLAERALWLLDIDKNRMSRNIPHIPTANEDRYWNEWVLWQYGIDCESILRGLDIDLVWFHGKDIKELDKFIENSIINKNIN